MTLKKQEGKPIYCAVKGLQLFTLLCDMFECESVTQTTQLITLGRVGIMIINGD